MSFLKTIFLLTTLALSASSYANQSFEINCPLLEHTNAHAFMRAEISGEFSLQNKKASGTVNLKLVDKGHNPEVSTLSNVIFDGKSIQTTNFQTVKAELGQGDVRRLILVMNPAKLSRVNSKVQLRDGRLYKTKCSFKSL